MEIAEKFQSRLGRRRRSLMMIRVCAMGLQAAMKEMECGAVVAVLYLSELESDAVAVRNVESDSKLIRLHSETDNV